MAGLVVYLALLDYRDCAIGRNASVLGSSMEDIPTNNCLSPTSSSTSWQDTVQIENPGTDHTSVQQDNGGAGAEPFGKGLVAVSIESTKCILCLASFKSAEELRAHIRIVHARSARHKRRVIIKENVSNNPDEQQELKPERAPTPLTRCGRRLKNFTKVKTNPALLSTFFQPC